MLQIVSALLACAAAAPSGLAPIIAPVVYSAAVAVPAAVPTISPGDIQAAAIDAQVKANDLARAAADKAQEITDQAVEDINGRAITDATLANEKNIEAFWSNEDKKWQALDAIKTAEAQIDGAAASNADAYAKSALGAHTFIAAQPAPVLRVAPVIAAPIAPVVYSPYVAAVKSVSTQTVEVKAEANKEEQAQKTEKAEEASVKIAEPVAAEGDSVQVEAATAEKVATAEKAAEVETKPFVIANPVVAPFVGVYRYNVALPGVSSFVAQPVINYATSYQQVHGVLAPTVVKHAW